MVLTADQQRVKALLTETITLLCKNGLHFQSKFCIEGLIGITLDEDDVFLVNINETFHTHIDDTGSNEQVSSHPVVEEPLNFHRINKKRLRSPSTPDPLMQVESNATDLSNSLCKDAAQGQIILSRSAVSCIEQPSGKKSEIVASGFSQYVNVHNLQDVSFKEEVVQGGNSDILQTLTIQEASRKTNEFNVCADKNEALTVQETVEPVRKRPLTDGKDNDKKSKNKHGHSQSFSSAISCDMLSQSDGEVIHIKEETASDEDLAHSENLSYDYLSLYGVDVSQGCSAPTVTAVPPSDKSPQLSLPGCSTWSRQNSWEQSTSHNLQVSFMFCCNFMYCFSFGESIFSQILLVYGLISYGHRTVGYSHVVIKTFGHTGFWS